MGALLRIAPACDASKKGHTARFQIPADRKQKLQQIADREVLSVSQICEILLRIGAEQYGKEGPRFLQRFLDRRKAED